MEKSIINFSSVDFDQLIEWKFEIEKWIQIIIEKLVSLNG